MQKSEAASSLLTPGKSVAGIDGCKGGWLIVRRNGDGRFAPPFVIAHLDKMPDTDMTVIDIPIGLPESGRRDCDLEAGKLLGRRRSSVFTGVRRPLLDFDDYAVANAWAKDDGAGLSKQMWHILPKIREVDRWISPERNRSFKEGHPELAFMAARGEPMPYYKKTPEGECDRIEVLADFVDPDVARAWLEQRPRAAVARDDIIDATALCRSAARILSGLHDRVPADPPTDGRGLPMEMVF